MSQGQELVGGVVNDCLAPLATHAAADLIEVTCLTRFEDLAQLESNWNELMLQYPAATVFHSYVWTRAWWSAFGASRELRLFVFRRDARVIGFAPMMQTRCRIRGLPMRQLSFFYNRHTLRGDAILPIAPQGCLAALCRYLAKHRGEWDVWYLPNAPEASTLRAGLHRATEAIGLGHDEWEPGRHYRFLSFEGTWQDYFSARSHNFRKRLNKIRNRMKAFGEVSYEVVTERAAMQQCLPELFALEQRSWHGTHEGAALAEVDRQFIRELVDQLPATQQTEFHVLRLGAQPIASVILFSDPGKRYGFLTHFDAQYARASPGTLLFFHMLQQVWRPGMTEFDFNGDTDSIRHWTPDARLAHSTRVYSNSLYGRCLQLMRKVTKHVTQLVQRRGA